MTIFSDSPAGMNIAIRRKHDTFSDLPEGMNTVQYCPKVKTRKVLRGNILIFLITLVGERDIKRIYSLFMTFYCKMTC